MNIMGKRLDGFDKYAALVFFIIAGLSDLSFAAERPKPSLSEVPIEVLSADITRFEKPLRIGPGKRAIEYQQALVLKIEVDRLQFDSLPPSMEPFLYIGREEYHIHAIDRKNDPERLILTFHIRNWEKLRDGDPMVLTIDHGAPARNPEKYAARAPRFKKNMIRDATRGRNP